MIINRLYFLFGVAVTLLVMCAALWIAAKVMERKIKKMEQELEGMDGGKHEQETM